jgi:hypothetical protein
MYIRIKCIWYILLPNVVCIARSFGVHEPNELIPPLRGKYSMHNSSHAVYNNKKPRGEAAGFLLQ